MLVITEGNHHLSFPLAPQLPGFAAASNVAADLVGQQFCHRKSGGFHQQLVKYDGDLWDFMGNDGDLGMQQLDGTLIVELIYDSEGGWQ